MRTVVRTFGVLFASLAAAFFVGPGFVAAVDIDSSRYIIRSTPSIEPSTQSGAYRREYTFTVPAGRQGIQPSLVLAYASGENDNMSIFGYGWSLSIPAIQRAPKHGTDDLYTRHDFTSTLSGELNDVTLTDVTHGTFGARVDDGSMLSYVYNADETWTVTDKSGTTYTFGGDADARVADPADAAHVYRWMLTRVEDVHGNTVDYTYTTDGAQVYPSAIVYGDYRVDFMLASRSDAFTSHAAGFAVTTSYRVSGVTVAVGSQTVRAYALDYTTGSGGLRSLLSQITETATTDDGASSITNPVTTFTYSEGNSGWTSGSISFPETISGTGAGSLGVYLFDMNGDAIPDIIKARNGSRAIYTGNADGTWTATTVTTPIDFASPIGKDMGVRVADVDGDGALDLLYARYLSTGALDETVYINNGDGTGWTESTTMSIPIGFTTDGGIDIGVLVFDVDGDGLPDIVRSRDGSTSLVYINNGDGTGWTEDTGYTVPVYFATIAARDIGTRPLDVNGDGLVDLAYGRYTSSGSLDQAIYINNGDGTGWTLDSSWVLPMPFLLATGGDVGTRAMDVNGDGLVDFVRDFYEYSDSQSVYVNTGAGWVLDSGITTPLPFTNGAVDFGVRVDDFDADGLADFLRSRSGSSDALYLASGNMADMLTAVTTSTGASTAVTYGSSANGSNPNVPFVLQLTDTVTEDDGLGNTATKTYDYADGDWYYASSFDRVFAGFGIVSTTDDDGTTTQYFHQGNTTNSAQGERADTRAKIGLRYREERTDTSGHVYRVTIDDREQTSLGTDRDFVYTASSVELLYGSAATHVDRGTAFTYDADGNVRTRTEYGAVTGADDGSMVDTGDDMRTTATVYATDASGIVRNRPAEVTVTDVVGTTVAQTRYLYDDLAYGSVTDGNVTTESRWISGADYASTTYTYDTYGNVRTVTAPDGGVTTTTYETVAHQYPSTVTDALGNVTTQIVALSTGKPTSVTDANGSVTATTYDALGRPTEETRSSDTSATTMETTKTWSYSDTTTPRFVTAHVYLSSTLFQETVTFVDGYDRAVATKTLAADGGAYNETQTTYDALGRVATTTLPAAAADATYDTVTMSADLAQTFTYDTLGRVTSVVDANGTTTTTYDGFTKTVTDANGVDKAYETDGLGRLVAVVEYISGVPYTTTYTYTATDTLSGMTDSLGNVRAFTYDGRGLRLTAEDLHAPGDTTFGTWTFTYDAAGNLATRTSPNGVTTTFTYDALHRTRTEDASSTTGTDVTYTYDSCTYGIGRLCATSVDGGATTATTYTVNGRVATETKTVAGTPYTTTTTYDRAGNALTVTHPDGTVVRTTYNAIGAVATVEEQAPSASSFTTVTSAYTYGPDGQVTSQTNGNGTLTTNTYDAAHRYRLTRKVTTGMTAATTTTTTTTVTFAPATGDGMTYKNLAGWDAAHDATTGVANGTATTATVGVGTTPTTNIIYRGLLPFDTSSIPDDATVTGATLAVFVNGKNDTDDDGDDFITLVQSTQASASAIVTADYARTGATNNPTEGVDTIERKDITALTANAWTTFALNATGQGFVDKTGTTKLALREGHDVTDSPFTPTSTTTAQYDSVVFRTGEYTGTTYDPVLTVTYTQTTTTPATPTTLQDVTYTYDAVGNITRLVDASSGVTAKTTDYTYDDLSRLTEESVTGAANGDNTSVTYAYNAIGNILSRSDVGTYTYAGDTVGNYANPHAVTSIAKTDGTTLTYTYDANGNVTSDGATTYTWDYANRLVSSAVSSTTTTTTTTTVTFAPSAGDGFTYKNIAGWDAAHDAATGVVNAAAITGTVGSGTTPTTNIIYRGLLPFDTSSIPDDATITSATLSVYINAKNNIDDDGDDFITLVQSTQASATAIVTADYARTGATNNPTEGVDTTGRKDLTSIAAGTWLTFTLNATGQGFVDKTGTTKLALREGHDVVDSPFTPTSTTTAQYNSIAFRTGEYTGTTYDPVLTVTYTQTSTVTAPVSATAYTYDANGARASKAVTTTATGTTATTRYPTGSYAVEDGVATVYIAGAGGVNAASVENTGATSSTLSTIATDHLGSTVVVTDATGAATEILDYHGYGTTRLTSGTSHAKKTFIGQYADDETSLSYLNARYYDPTRGQFLSEDSVFLGMGADKDALLVLLADPQSQNSYSYARDNPISASDPLGTSWWTGVQGFVKGAAIAVAVVAVVAALPFEIPAAVVAGGIVVGIGLTAGAVVNTRHAFDSGAISADQRDYQYGSIAGGVVGGLVGGVAVSRISAAVVDAAESGAQSMSSIRSMIGNAAGKTVNGEVTIPEGWTVSPSARGGGTRYTNPSNPIHEIRLMPGKSSAEFPASRSPYMRIRTESGYLDAKGAVSSDNAATHIPIRSIR